MGQSSNEKISLKLRKLSKSICCLKTTLEGSTLPDQTGHAGQFLTTDGSVASWGAGGGGEANTASSVGGGLSIFDTKVGVDLQFNSLAAADFDLSSNVITIGDDAITYAKMQNVSATSRFIGRITAGSGDPEELTGTQATTLLDTFTSGLKGLVPASGGGTTNFLRADGTWAAAGGGLTIGTTAITSGTNKRFVFDNSAVVGESAMLTQETDQVLVTAGSTSVIPFVIKHAAVSPSSANFVIKRSDDVEFFRVDNGGGLQIFGSCTNPISNAYAGSMELGYAGGVASITAFNRGDSSWKTFTIAAGGINFQNSGTVKGNFNTSGRFFVGGNTSATAVLHLAAGTATASTAPLKFTSGTNLSAAEAGAMEYNGRFFLTDTDATQRHIVQAAASTKTTAGAPYTNDGYIEVVINGTTVRLMTTA